MTIANTKTKNKQSAKEEFLLLVVYHSGIVKTNYID
jgi:hypothetical protein